MSPLWFLELLALLLLPGLAAIQLAGFRASSLSEMLALSFGLGASVAAIVLILKTSGFRLLGVVLIGVPPDTGWWILGSSAAVLVAATFVRRKPMFFVRPTRGDYYLVGLLVVQLLLVVVHFAEYPVFPEFHSQDFTEHVVIATDLQSGTTTSIPTGILYYGVQAILAAALSAVSDPALIVTQYTMGVVVVLSPLLVYAATRAISKSQLTGIAATGVYVIGGFIWFGSVFNAGLFPNFYGLLSTLFLLVAASMVLNESRNPFSWAVYLVATTNAYISHYSTVTIIPALVLLPVFNLLLTKKLGKAPVGLALIPIVPALLVATLEPGLVGGLLSFVTSKGGGNISGSTALSAFFGWYPFLRYIIVEITSDTASLAIFVMAFLGAYYLLRERTALALTPVVWFLSAAVAAPQSEAAWRFSYVALTPLVMLAAAGISIVIPKPGAVAAVRRRGKRQANPRRNRLILAGFIFLVMVAGSWGTTLMGDALNNGRSTSRAQLDVYSSMLWFAKNTPADSKLISVTDSTYNYTGLVTGKPASYSPLITPDDVLAHTKGQRDVYVVLTRVGTVVVSPTDYADLLRSYQGNRNFSLAYSNADVQLYSVSNPAPPS